MHPEFRFTISSSNVPSFMKHVYALTRYYSIDLLFFPVNRLNTYILAPLPLQLKSCIQLDFPSISYFPAWAQLQAASTALLPIPTITTRFPVTSFLVASLK